MIVNLDQDASVATDKTIQIFKDLIKDKPNLTENDKMVAINRAHILALNSTSAKEVLEMFINRYHLH